MRKTNTIEDRLEEDDPNDDYPMSICFEHDSFQQGEVRELPATVAVTCQVASLSVNVFRNDSNTIELTYTGTSAPNPPGNGKWFLWQFRRRCVHDVFV